MVQLSRENLRTAQRRNRGRRTLSYPFVMLRRVVETRCRKVYMVHSVQRRPAMVNLTLTVIGKPAIVSADDPPMPLLYAPRNDTGLHGPRFGRGLAQCGACTVHVDGKPVRSCAYP